jgi:hypothetical protein
MGMNCGQKARFDSDEHLPWPGSPEDRTKRKGRIYHLPKSGRCDFALCG